MYALLWHLQHLDKLESRIYKRSLLLRVASDKRAA